MKMPKTCELSWNNINVYYFLEGGDAMWPDLHITMKLKASKSPKTQRKWEKNLQLICNSW